MVTNGYYVCHYLIIPLISEPGDLIEKAHNQAEIPIFCGVYNYALHVLTTLYVRILYCTPRIDNALVLFRFFFHMEKLNTHTKHPLVTWKLIRLPASARYIYVGSFLLTRPIIIVFFPNLSAQQLFFKFLPKTQS